MEISHFCLTLIYFYSPLNSMQINGNMANRTLFQQVSQNASAHLFLWQTDSFGKEANKINNCLWLQQYHCSKLHSGWFQAPSWKHPHTHAERQACFCLAFFSPPTENFRDHDQVYITQMYSPFLLRLHVWMDSAWRNTQYIQYMTWSHRLRKMSIHRLLVNFGLVQSKKIEYETCVGHIIRPNSECICASIHTTLSTILPILLSILAIFL